MLLLLLILLFIFENCVTNNTMSFTLYVREHNATRDTSMCYVLCCLFLFVIQFILYINILHVLSIAAERVYSCARVGWLV